MTEDEIAKAEPSKNDPVRTIDHQAGTTGAGTTASDLQGRAAAEKKFEGGTV
jgi:hypothetical protein